MKVEILGSINSGEYNKGDIVDFPEPQAKALCASGAAKPTKEKVSKTEPSLVEKSIPNTIAQKNAAKEDAPKKKKAAEKGKGKSKGENK